MLNRKLKLKSDINEILDCEFAYRNYNRRRTANVRNI